MGYPLKGQNGGKKLNGLRLSRGPGLRLLSVGQLLSEWAVVTILLTDSVGLDLRREFPIKYDFLEMQPSE
jgi:hypothetical protein